jgi:hypothetical protein
MPDPRKAIHRWPAMPQGIEPAARSDDTIEPDRLPAQPESLALTVLASSATRVRNWSPLTKPLPVFGADRLKATSRER